MASTLCNIFLLACVQNKYMTPCICMCAHTPHISMYAVHVCIRARTHTQAAGVAPSPSDSVQWHHRHQPFQEQAWMTGFLNQEVGRYEFRRREESASQGVLFLPLYPLPPARSSFISSTAPSDPRVTLVESKPVLPMLARSRGRQAGRTAWRAGLQHRGCQPEPKALWP